MDYGDTIAAIATPLGEGGLSVLRISGPAAFSIVDKIFVPPRGGVSASAAPANTLHYGFIEANGNRLDEVMLAIMRAPRSFTREDVAEISCHGGMLTSKSILDALIDHGCRLAEPGEFTRRAFLNGRIDLTQAEAVIDVIHARTELALAAAQSQLAGRLSLRINALRDDLMRLLAHIEAHIDFPDEDIAPDTRQQMLERLDAVLLQIADLLDHAAEGEVLRQGIRAAIIGSPNAGKSSLLNALLGQNRAIVAPTAGTTRDTIEAMANIRGIPVVFVDTAGLRQSEDPVEMEGIRRSREMVSQAELILYVIDGNRTLSPEEQSHLQSPTPQKEILVINKSDLPYRADLQEEVRERAVGVSCVTGAGLELLKQAIVRHVWSGKVQAGKWEAIVNSRHREALVRARAGLGVARDGLATELTLELVALDLRIGVNALGEVVGKTTTEDLLDSIFSQFCIGK